MHHLQVITGDLVRGIFVFKAAAKSKHIVHSSDIIINKCIKIGRDQGCKLLLKWSKSKWWTSNENATYIICVYRVYLNFILLYLYLLLYLICTLYLMFSYFRHSFFTPFLFLSECHSGDGWSANSWHSIYPHYWYKRHVWHPWSGLSI